MHCRFCKSELTQTFVDLINSPPSNSFLSEEQLNAPEAYFPLKLYVCDSCFLVQVDEYKKADEIFDEGYVYFSSYSKSWLEHSKAYTEKMVERFGFDHHSLVIEVASNDGYLLQYFKEKNIQVLGIEPTAGTAAVAVQKGIDTLVEFFGESLATTLAGQDKKADLLLGNNVLAHVPDINDFVKGLRIALKDNGLITMEFPHLLQLIRNSQFDTIYHEHFSYLSFTTVKTIFEAQGLQMFDVEEIPTHGGSLRIYAKHAADSSKEISERVQALLHKELEEGMTTIEYYQGFQEKVQQVKLSLLDFLIEQKKQGKVVAAYGAAAKGNTLLNYCGIKNDLISFAVDASPHKQGKFLPGSHIPVLNEQEITRVKPDYILILPWNIKDEISTQLSYIKQWGAKFAVPIPEFKIFE